MKGSVGLEVRFFGTIVRALFSSKFRARVRIHTQFFNAFEESEDEGGSTQRAVGPRHVLRRSRSHRLVRARGPSHRVPRQLQRRDLQRHKRLGRYHHRNNNREKSVKMLIWQGDERGLK